MSGVKAWWLIQPDIHLFHDARVFVRIRAREFSKPLRIAADRLGGGLEQCVACRLVGECVVARCVEPRDRGGWRAERSKHGKPGFEANAAVAALLQGRQLRHATRSLVT